MTLVLNLIGQFALGLRRLEVQEEQERETARAAEPNRSNADNNDDKSMSGGTSEKQEALAVLLSTKAFFRSRRRFIEDLDAIAKVTAKDFEALRANLQGVLQKTTPQEPEEEPEPHPVADFSCAPS